MIKYSIIENFVKIHPHKLALKCKNTSITWVEFKHHCEKLINNILKYCDLQTSKPIIFISRNSMELILLGAAFATLEVPFQGIDYNLNTTIAKQLIKKLHVKHVFLSDEFRNEFLELSDVCQVQYIENFFESSKKLVNSELYNEKSKLDKKFVSYAFTSGTSGFPKIVYRNSSFDKKRFEYFSRRCKFKNDDVHLVCLPMYHVSSTGWLRLFLNLGCSIIIHNFIDTFHLCEDIHLNNVSTTIMSPIILKKFIMNLDGYHVSNYFKNLKFILTGGKNCDANTKKLAIETLGNIIYEYYGTTETGVNTFLNSEEALRYPGSVGKEFEGNKIEILNGDNKPVGVDEMGRIAIHSYMNMENYIGHEAEYIILEGNKYLLTSDYGYKNNEGYLYITQRTSCIPKIILNLYGIENDLLKLDYLDDVHVAESNTVNIIQINIVLKKYCPFFKILENVRRICKNYNIPDPMVRISSMLDYTLTGKIKLQASSHSEVRS